METHIRARARLGDPVVADVPKMKTTTTTTRRKKCVC